ncbi:MAG: DUF1015 family protein [Acidimicrobiales bacterium]
MTGIQPFRGMVVLQDMAHDVVSPAYDALSVVQRQQFRLDHPHSYLHVTRSAEDEPDAATVDNSTLVARGRAALERIVGANLFASHGSPALYVYRLVDGAHAQCGLVCEIPSGYYHSVAKPHEATRAERATLLAEHFGAVKAMSSPVACTVRDDGSLERELHAVTHGEPILDIAGGDGLQQTVWRIDDREAQARITERLRDEPLFIIDGHHRSAANQQLCDRGVALPVLTTIFPEQSLHLVGFHRLVRLRDGVDQALLLRAIQRRFRVETVSDVTMVSPGQVAVVLADEWHLVHFDERPVAGGASILLGSLDPVVLEREVLVGILGRHGEFDIAYTPDIEPFAVIVAEAAENDQIPIFVPPVAIADMMAVAEGGVIMPAKSTYFTPKVRSGVFLRVFDELD